MKIIVNKKDLSFTKAIDYLVNLSNLYDYFIQYYNLEKDTLKVGNGNDLIIDNNKLVYNFTCKNENEFGEFLIDNIRYIQYLVKNTILFSDLREWNYNGIILYLKTIKTYYKIKNKRIHLRDDNIQSQIWKYFRDLVIME